MAATERNIGRRRNPSPGEVAGITGGRDITRGLVDPLEILWPTDWILTQEGYHHRNLGPNYFGWYTAWKDLFRDDQVHSTFQQRRGAVVGRKTIVLPGGSSPIDKDAAEFVEDILKHIEWDDVTDKMLFARFFGFSIAEIMWARDGRHIIVDDIRVRERARFGFGPDQLPRLFTEARPLGERVPKRKFWWFSSGADHDDEPYGIGLAHHLYWLVYFKRHCLKQWLMYLRRYGTGSLKATMPKGFTSEQKAGVLEAMQAVEHGSSIVVPEGVVLDILEHSSSATVSYSALYARMDAAISKVIVGQTMTTDEGSSRAQAGVHYEVREDLIAEDAKLVNSSFRKSVLTWLMEYNFPGAKVPVVKRDLQTKPDLNKQAERDVKIHSMGYRPSQEYIEQTYNIDVEPVEMVAGMGQGQPEPPGGNQGMPGRSVGRPDGDQTRVQRQDIGPPRLTEARPFQYLNKEGETQQQGGEAGETPAT